MLPDDLYDPVALSGWWGWVGLGLMLLAVAWVVYAIRRGRRAPVEPPPPPPPPPPPSSPVETDPYAAARRLHLGMVDTLEARYAAGELDARGLHLELSTVVRDFATVRRGVNARILTLRELRRVSGTKRLAALIESYYRPAFARHGGAVASAESALAGAREVIREW